MNIQAYSWGDYHMHFQVVEWVEENVPDDTWVAAAQTGTLGYFHDRTINLDGKVNPAALHARIFGRARAYLLDTPATYVVDWVDLIEIISSNDEVAREFKKILEDKESNLAVLKREIIDD